LNSIANRNGHLPCLQALALRSILIRDLNAAVGQRTHDRCIGFGNIANKQRRSLNTGCRIGRANARPALSRRNQQQHRAIRKGKVARSWRKPEDNLLSQPPQ
jgi:hypothetical protein